MNRHFTGFHIFFSFLLLCGTTFFTHLSFGQKQKFTNSLQTIEQTYSENIRTIQFYREGWQMSIPVLHTNDESFLILSFDDLAEEQRSLSYTITHCNYDWTPSDLISTDYLDGFEENQLYDYAFSRNTYVSYTNYFLPLPNDDVKFKVSGNYLLTVFDDDNKSQPLLTRKFYVVDSNINIGGKIVGATFDRYRGTQQEIRFTVAHPNFKIRDPHTELHVMIQKNGRKDIVREAKPSFIRSKTIVYENTKTNVFQGENEFRRFDLKSTKTATLGLQNIEYRDGIFQATVTPDKLRRSPDYSYMKDINGRYFIKTDDLDESDIQADYVLTHFTLPLDYPLFDGGIYVFGQLSDWNCSPLNKMTYNQQLKQYEASIFLKQGLYNYQYVYLENGSQTPESKEFEGSHMETENEYTIFVYYRTIGDRYDQLIGVQGIQ